MTRRRFRLIATLMLFFFALGISAVSYWYWTRPTHEVVAYLQFRTTPQLKIGDQGRFQFPNDGAEDYRRDMERAAALMVSPLVLGPVVSNSETAAVLASEADPVAGLQDKIEFSIPVPELLAVRIAGRSNQMERYASVLDAVVDSYLLCEAREEESRISELIRLLKDQEIAARKRIQELAEEVRMISVANSGSPDLKEGADAEFKQLELEREKTVLAAISVRKRELEISRSAPRKVIKLQGATVRRIERSRSPLSSL